MPTAISFTIKNGATTPADTVFTCLQPASGNLPAVYQARSAGPNGAAQPKIAISSSGTQKTREVRRTIRTPYYVVGTDGVPKVVDSCFTEIRTVLPESVPDAVRADHQAYVANSCDTAQVVDTDRNGYAPS